MSESQLRLIAGEYQATAEEAERIHSSIDPARAIERPRPDRWSVAECLEHLSVTTRAYLPIWSRALDEARARGPADTGQPFRTDFKGWLLAWLLEPPVRLRLPAPGGMQPVPVRDGERAWGDFRECQAQIIAVIDSARGLALDRIIIGAPFQRHLRYSVWSSFRVVAAHQRRHLWQAARVQQRLEKPPSA